MYNEQNNNDLNNKEMQSNSESQETFDQQHEYITYGRRFISYKWYKPILVKQAAYCLAATRIWT